MMARLECRLALQERLLNDRSTRAESCAGTRLTTGVYTSARSAGSLTADARHDPAPLSKNALSGMRSPGGLRLSTHTPGRCEVHLRPEVQRGSRGTPHERHTGRPLYTVTTPTRTFFRVVVLRHTFSALYTLSTLLWFKIGLRKTCHQVIIDDLTTGLPHPRLHTLVPIFLSHSLAC